MMPHLDKEKITSFCSTTPSPKIHKTHSKMLFTRSELTKYCCFDQRLPHYQPKSLIFHAQHLPQWMLGFNHDGLELTPA